MDMRAAADWAPELGDGEYERSCTVDGDAGREEEVGYIEDPNDACLLYTSDAADDLLTV